ncbi:MAG: 50S ribosomal protein L25 [Patescibacteria group bacterium]|nr:50S ribosomal protein L25 [Patescibacteria group bacterium]
MTELTLNVNKRADGADKARALVRQSLVPGVVYGHGIANQNIVLEKNVLEKIYKAAGEAKLIDLKIGDDKPVKVLIQDIQREPVHDMPIHVDFRQVRMDEKIIADMVIKFIGESAAVKELGGTLVKNYYTLQVECMPSELSNEIVVDISNLKNFEDVIRVKDLAIPPSIHVLDEPERSIAVVKPPMTEAEIAELEKAPAAGVDQVEVAAKGKAPEEGEEGAEEAAPAAGAKPEKEEPKKEKNK